MEILMYRRGSFRNVLCFIFYGVYYSQIGDPCYHAVEILVHHLAVKVPDKAEFRQKASSAIVELTLGLPQEYFSRLVR